MSFALSNTAGGRRHLAITIGDLLSACSSKLFFSTYIYFFHHHRALSYTYILRKDNQKPAAVEEEGRVRIWSDTEATSRYYAIFRRFPFLYASCGFTCGERHLAIVWRFLLRVLGRHYTRPTFSSIVIESFRIHTCVAGRTATARWC